MKLKKFIYLDKKLNLFEYKNWARFPSKLHFLIIRRRKILNLIKNQD